MPATGIGTGTLSYGGIPFTVYKSQVSAKPVPDSSGRTTKAVTHSIQVRRSLVEPDTGETTTDNVLAEMRDTLTKYGLPLILDLKGYGPLRVNVDHRVRDINFGPKPQLLSWDPAGNDKNAIVDWNCETTIPECADARYQFGIAELNYTIEHRWDRDGYSRISTQGHLEIPMTLRAGSRRLPDHVDRYREQLLTQAPLGFNRVDPVFRMNEAKTRLDFSWVDEAMRVGLPTGTTQVKFKHRASAPGPAFLEWMNNLSATISVPITVQDKSFALRVFLSIVADRLDTLRRNFPVAPAPAQPPPAANGGWWQNVAAQVVMGSAPGGGLSSVVAASGAGRPQFCVLPMRFSVENDPTSAATSFEYSYRVILRRTLQEAVAAQGVWRNFPGASFSDWRRYMEQSKVFSVRGPHDLRWNPSDEAVIDLCATGRPSVAQPRVGASSSGGSGGTWGSSGGGGGGGGSVRNPELKVLGGSSPDDLDPSQANTRRWLSLPNPEATWVAYTNVLIYRETQPRYARHRPLAGKVYEPQPRTDAAGDPRQMSRNPVGTVATATKDVPDTLQEIDAPPALVILRGGAVRLGEDTPLPNLLTCKGLLARRNMVLETWQRTIAHMGDIPLIQRYWEIEFLLDTPPMGRLPVLADPVQGMRGGNLQ